MASDSGSTIRKLSALGVLGMVNSNKALAEMGLWYFKIDMTLDISHDSHLISAKLITFRPMLEDEGLSRGKYVE